MFAAESYLLPDGCDARERDSALVVRGVLCAAPKQLRVLCVGVSRCRYGESRHLCLLDALVNDHFDVGAGVCKL